MAASVAPVPPVQTPPASKKKGFHSWPVDERAQYRILKPLKNHDVLVTLINGASVTGQLIGLDTYALALRRTVNDRELLIYKHGILCIEAAPPAE